MSNAEQSQKPDAIREAEARVAAAKAGGTPPTPPADAPTPAQAPASAESVDDLKAKLTEQQRRLDKLSGEYGGNLDALRRQIAQTTEAMELLKAENERLKEVATQPPPATPNGKPISRELAALLEGMPADFRDSYGEVFEGVAIMLANFRKLYGGKDVEPLREEVRKVRAQSEGQQFLAMVERQSPGFIEDNGDVEARIPGKQDWIDHLNSEMPNGVETYREYIGDPPNVKRLVLVHKEFTAGKKGSRRPKVDIAGQAAVRSTGTPEPAPAGGGKPLLKKADYEALKAQMMRPDTLMTVEEKNENWRKMRAFQEAAGDGRLVD